MIITIPKIDLKTINVLKEEFEWQVILYNCNCHTCDEVIEQLMKAIGCSTEKASQLMYVADQIGSVSVYKGNQESCNSVANILSNTGLLVKVEQ